MNKPEVFYFSFGAVTKSISQSQWPDKKMAPLNMLNWIHRSDFTQAEALRYSPSFVSYRSVKYGFGHSGPVWSAGIARNERLLLSRFTSLAARRCQSEAGGGSQGAARASLALRGASSRDRGSETSNWTAAIWMENRWGSRLGPSLTGWSSHAGVQVLKQEEVAVGGGPVYDFIIMQTSSPRSDSHITANYFFLLHTCFSAAVVSADICDQFVRFMRQKLGCVLKAACVYVSPCHIGCWQIDSSSRIPQIPLARSQW